MSSPCTLHASEVAVVGKDSRTSSEGDPCAVEAGAVFRFDYAAPPAPPRKRMEPVTQPPAPAPVAPVVPELPAVPAPATLTATVEQPAAPTPADLTKIAESTGGNPMLTIALAAIAVLGGGAAWKHWQKVSEQKHEQAMEDKRLAAQAQGLGNAQPIPCQTVAKVQAEAITKLTEAVAAYDARITAVEKKSRSVSADFDGDDVSERLEKAEREIKALKKTLREQAGA